MEGALGERLKREYHLTFDEHIAMAKLIYQEEGVMALKKLWTEYYEIAKKYKLPFLATTPTRRANKERVPMAGRFICRGRSRFSFCRNYADSSRGIRNGGCYVRLGTPIYHQLYH